MAKILLVEDDKSLREIYGVRLQAEGYEIVSAGDGEEALALAIKERPDLIVSDVMMPKISGFDMLDILRSTTETKDIKVIMMTALSSEDQRARGEALGADRYLVKSQVGIEDVVRTVHDVMGDGVATSAPAAPSFAPVNPLPVATPVAPAPIAPVQPAPLDPTAPTPLPVINLPGAPAPAAPALPVETINFPPIPEPMAAPTQLPEPTAPFSSPAPASLGDRMISPLGPIDTNPTTVTDFSSQMNQELNAAAPAPAPVAPPVQYAAPAPLPPAPTQPLPQQPLPPQPPTPGAGF